MLLSSRLFAPPLDFAGEPIIAAVEIPVNPFGRSAPELAQPPSGTPWSLVFLLVYLNPGLTILLAELTQNVRWYKCASCGLLNRYEGIPDSHRGRQPCRRVVRQRSLE